MPQELNPGSSYIKVASMSQFRSDHPDYDGLSDRNKRRRINRLLRETNFACTSTLLKHADVTRLRDSLPGELQAHSGSVNQMHAEGIIWVRCNENSGYAVSDGMPVIFDIVTGSEVTGFPAEFFYAGRPYRSKEWNIDEYTIVGYAVSDPVAVSDHYEVPIRLYRDYQPHQGRFLAGLSYGFGDGERSQPEVDDPGDFEWMIDPAPSWQVPSWREIGIYKMDRQYNADNEYSGVFIKECSYGVVLNPYPFGFTNSGGDSNKADLWVQRSGDSFVVDRPWNPKYWPRATINWTSSDHDGIIYTPGPLTGEGGLIKASGLQAKWLPTFQWKYRVTGYIDVQWTNSTAGSKNVDFTLPVINFGHIQIATYGSVDSMQLEAKDGSHTIPVGSVYSFVSFTTEGCYRVPFSCIMDIEAYAPAFDMQVTNLPELTPDGYSTCSGHITIEPIF